MKNKNIKTTNERSQGEERNTTSHATAMLQRAGNLYGKLQPISGSQPLIIFKGTAPNPSEERI